MLKNKKILIIDDDPDFVETTKIILESRQYEVYSASGPEEGIKKVPQEKPDLIILDVMWPEKISGFEVCRRIKKQANFKNIPIIMITAVDKAYGLGFENVAGDETWLPCDDYLNKPVDPEQLLSKVEELLQNIRKYN